MPRKPKPSDELPEDHQQTMHLKLDKTDLASLDAIVARMKRDPILGRMKVDLGRQNAARWAIAYCIEHMPARFTTTG